MKFSSILRLMFVSAVLAASVPFFGFSAGTIQPPAAVGLAVDEPDPVLAEIAKYKQWKLVNPTPQLMEPVAAIACARVFGRDEGSPHLHKYISVYVNSVGADAMLRKRKPVYPKGSIIVKEKLGEPASKEPELLTVMLKREKGYNPASGDWEYLVLDGAATEITQRGKLASCNSCHTAYREYDYVTRTYLTTETERRLK